MSFTLNRASIPDTHVSAPGEAVSTGWRMSPRRSTDTARGLTAGLKFPCGSKSLATV